MSSILARPLGVIEIPCGDEYDSVKIPSSSPAPIV